MRSYALCPTMANTVIQCLPVASIKLSFPISCVLYQMFNLMMLVYVPSVIHVHQLSALSPLSALSALSAQLSRQLCSSVLYCTILCSALHYSVPDCTQLLPTLANSCQLCPTELALSYSYTLTMIAIIAVRAHTNAQQF